MFVPLEHGVSTVPVGLTPTPGGAAMTLKCVTREEAFC